MLDDVVSSLTDDLLTYSVQYSRNKFHAKRNEPYYDDIRLVRPDILVEPNRFIPADEVDLIFSRETKKLVYVGVYGGIMQHFSFKHMNPNPNSMAAEHVQYHKDKDKWKHYHQVCFNNEGKVISDFYSSGDTDNQNYYAPVNEQEVMKFLKNRLSVADASRDNQQERQEMLDYLNHNLAVVRKSLPGETLVV